VDTGEDMGPIANLLEKWGGYGTHYSSMLNVMKITENRKVLAVLAD